MSNELTPKAKDVPIKLFDVDVKVSADTIVSIEITDQDNPFELAKHLQAQYNLSNETTQSLFEML